MSKRVEYVAEEATWVEQVLARPMPLILGLVLILVACGLLLWNEHRASLAIERIDRGAIRVYEVTPGRIDPSLEGKLVHVVGDLSTDEELVDTEFGVTEKAIRLLRRVEMFQWEEYQRTDIVNRSGGASEKVKTYHYSMVWRDHLIDSDRFHVTRWHRNVSQFPFQSRHFEAAEVALGARRVPPEMVAQVGELLPVKLDSNTPLPDYLTGHPHLFHGVLYVGDNPRKPILGDIRVTFLAVKAQTVSILAAQKGQSFAPYKLAGQAPIEVIASGRLRASALHPKAWSMKPVNHWSPRVVSALLMLLGWWFLLPAVIAAQGKPYWLERLMRPGVYTLSGGLGGGLITLLAGVSWLSIRPTAAVLLLLIGLGSVLPLWWINPQELDT